LIPRKIQDVKDEIERGTSGSEYRMLIFSGQQPRKSDAEEKTFQPGITDMQKY